VECAIWLLLLVLPQEGEARRLAESVSDRDPAASFAAISRLVDLSDTRKDEVEREAERLPAFYRDVLLSELKAKRDLGARFGCAPRISLKGSAKSVWHYLEEVGRQPGMKVHIEDWNRRMPTQPFDVDFREVLAIEAYVRLCGQSRLGTFNWSWLDDGIRVTSAGDGVNDPPGPRPWFFYRNIAIGQTMVSWRKVIDFSGPPRWVARLQFKVEQSLETKAVTWEDVRVIEALGDGGQVLSSAPAEETAIPGFESSFGAPSQPFEVALRLPDQAVTGLSRLRFRVTARVPTQFRRYEITEFSSGRTTTKGDGYFDVYVRPREGVTLVSDNLHIRIRPKSERHSRLAGVPFKVLYHFDRPGAGAQLFHFSGKGEEMAVGTPMCTLREGLWMDGGKPRRPLKIEVVIPVEIQDRPVYAEFRDIPLR